MRKLSAVRTKVGLAVIGGALLLTGAGVGASMAAGSPGTRPASDTSAVTSQADTSSPAAATTAADSAAVATQTAQSSSPSPASATVTRVTSPQPTGKPVMTVPPGITPLDPADPGRGGHDADGNYVPANPIPKAGEPPIVGSYVPLPSAPKLPGEPGYVPAEQTPTS